MPSPVHAVWQRLVWTLLAFSSALYFLSGNEADNDLWVHLLVGEDILTSGSIPRVDHLSYTVAGQPWVDHEWLTHVLFATAYDLGGGTGLWLLKLGLGLAITWLLWRVVARHTSDAWVRGVVMLLALSVLSRGFAIRPQIVTYLGLAWLLDWLTRPATGGGQGGAQADGVRATTGLAVVFLIWGNAHGGFILGLATLATYALVPPWPPRWRAWGMVALATAAVCVNPYGPSLLAYVWRELSAPHPLTEWQPVALHDPEQFTFFLLVALLTLTLPFGRSVRQRPWYALFTLTVLVVAFRQQRHTPLVALCAAAPLADQLSGAARWLRGRELWPLSREGSLAVRAGVLALVVAQLGLAAWRVTADRFQIVYQANEYPVGAVRFMRENGIRGNLALPLDWGGYVLFHGAPDVKVSIDGRFATVYPPDVVADNLDFTYDMGGRAKAFLDKYPATTLVLTATFAPSPVRHREGWEVRYRDEVAELFERGGEGEIEAATAPVGTLPFP